MTNGIWMWWLVVVVVVSCGCGGSLWIWFLVAAVVVRNGCGGRLWPWWLVVLVVACCNCGGWFQLRWHTTTTATPTTPATQKTSTTAANIQTATTTSTNPHIQEYEYQCQVSCMSTCATIRVPSNSNISRMQWAKLLYNTQTLLLMLDIHNTGQIPYALRITHLLKSITNVSGE